MSAPDQPQQRLRVVTFDNTPLQPPEPCSGGYLCCCTLCTIERDHHIATGVRGDPSNPFRKNKAA
jgi:hypothetical protein